MWNINLLARVPCTWEEVVYWHQGKINKQINKAQLYEPGTWVPLLYTVSPVFCKWQCWVKSQEPFWESSQDPKSKTWSFSVRHRPQMGMISSAHSPSSGDSEKSPRALCLGHWSHSTYSHSSILHSLKTARVVPWPLPFQGSKMIWSYISIIL